MTSRATPPPPSPPANSSASAGAKEHEGKRGATTFLLKRDTTLRNGAFSCRAKGANRFILAGADATAMSHAAYTLLERMGYRFDITETLRPTRYNLEGDSLSFSVTPATRYRGIRQHVNFPMDISSYRIEEAEAYVDNLLRLRFNKLTVHSYPGFWHVQPQGDTLLRAGNFFYDSPHRLTGSDILRRHVRDNEALFCIPEMEKLYFDLPEKSGRTIAWMRRLLQHAKERGMYLQFSIEPRLMGDKELDGVVRSIVKDYPMLDAIELMTEETGGWGPGCTRADVEKVLREDFGNEALADPVVTAAIRDRQADLAYLFKQEAENIRAIRRLSRDPLLKGKELKLGIYCTTFQAPAAYRLARLRAPELKVCIMPSHGSRGTNRALRGVVKTKADLAQTEIYNWIEFDGVMYLQQNAIEGIGGGQGMPTRSRPPTPCPPSASTTGAPAKTASRHAMPPRWQWARPPTPPPSTAASPPTSALPTRPDLPRPCCASETPTPTSPHAWATPDSPGQAAGEATDSSGA